MGMASFKNVIRRSAGRTATTTMSGGKEAGIGPPVQYGGLAEMLNPEELFVASINSCLMLVFYHFAENSGIEVESYEADAEGIVRKTKGALRFTNVNVQARVKASRADIRKKIQELAELAEKYCLASNSLKCAVGYNAMLVEEMV